MSRKLLLAHLALLGANLIFGVNYIVAKGIMPDYLEPRAIIFLRVTGASLVFWIAGLFSPREKNRRKDIPRFAVVAFFGVALNQVMFFEGLNLTTPINSAIIMVGIPIFVLLFSVVILGDKLTFNKITGIILGFIGAAYLILQGGNFSFNSDTFLGNTLVLVNVSSYALFLVLVKPLMSKYSPITVMKWVFLIGTIYVAPISINLVIASDFINIPVSIWMSIFYVIIFTTVLAYFLNNYSLKTISPTINSAYIYLQPAIATAISIGLGKESLTYTEIIAAAFIFTGVYFVSFRKVKQKLYSDK